MSIEKGIVERAFDLAKDGTCHNIDDIRRTLLRERYASVSEHLSGSTIKRQLLVLMKRYGN